MKKNLKKFVQFSFGQILVFLLGIIITPIITRLYLPVEMGKYSFFESLSSLVYAILILGLDQAFIRYFYSEKQEVQINLFYKVLFIPIVISILFFGLCLPFNNVFSDYLVGEQNSFIYFFFSLQVISSILLRFVTVLIRMRQNPTLFSSVLIGQKVIYLVMAIIFSYYDSNSYLNLIKAFLLSNIIVVIGGVLLSSKNFLFCKEKVNTTYKELFTFGVPFIFSNALIWIFQSIDKITIRNFCSYEQVGIYAGAASIVNLMTLFQSSFTVFWIPLAYEHYEKEPENIDFFVYVNEMVSYGMLILATVIVTCKDILIVFLGQDYKMAVEVFPFLLLMPIMYTVSETTSMGINFKNKSVYHIYISFLVSSINIIGNLCLVPVFGAKGAAISTGCAYVFFWLFRTLFSYKVYKIKFNLKQFVNGVLLFLLYCAVGLWIKEILINVIIGVLLIGVETWIYRKQVKEMLVTIRKLKNKRDVSV